jgi:hypothetical protein
MEATIALYEGHARATRNAADAMSRPDGIPFDDDVQPLCDDVAASTERFLAYVRTKWDRLLQGQLSDPTKTGQRLLEIMGVLAESMAAIEAVIARGGLRVDLTGFAAARKKLLRRAEEIREGWPLPDPVEIEAARRRMDNEGRFLTPEEFARGVDRPV